MILLVGTINHENIIFKIIFMLLVILLQHLLEYNDRPDLGHEDREMFIEDLVAALL